MSLYKTLQSQHTELEKYFHSLLYKLRTDDKLVVSSEILRGRIVETFTIADKPAAAIYFTGIGKNDTIAKKSANMLRSLNFNAHHISPVDAMHGDMGLLNNGDTIVAISKSGTTAELIHFLKYVRTFRNVNRIGIQVGDSKKGFNECCNTVIELPAVQEMDPWNLVPTISNIVTQLYIDGVTIDAMNDVHLTKEDFISSHPGGAIGQS